MSVENTASLERAPFRSHDPRLEPIAAKVMAGERLDFAEGLTLYGTSDVLAVGWLANYVRERMHGDVTYFNVNRHINPTNVCVAACKLCAFGRKKGDPAGYTMALEEAWQTAASGYSVSPPSCCCITSPAAVPPTCSAWTKPAGRMKPLLPPWPKAR